jgi:hypothetical protein
VLKCADSLVAGTVKYAALPDKKQPAACWRTPLTCLDGWLDALSVVNGWHTSRLLSTVVALGQHSAGQAFEHQHMRTTVCSMGLGIWWVNQWAYGS